MHFRAVQIIEFGAPLAIGDMNAMVLLAETFDGHMRAIGVLAVRWSAVDRLLYDLLRDRLRRLDDAEKLRECSAGKTRLDFFNKRLKDAELQTKEKSSLAHAVNQLLALCDERNAIVHGQYGIAFGDDGDMSVTWSDIGLRKREGEAPSPCYLEPASVTVGDILQHADAVYEASRPLFSVLHRRS